jgi:RNA polymerase sigma factor (sigma-70 family)
MKANLKDEMLMKKIIFLQKGAKLGSQSSKNLANPLLINVESDIMANIQLTLFGSIIKVFNVRVKEASDLPGNIAGAARIISEYGNFIRTIICYKVKDEDIAEDLFQDFYLSLVSKPIPAEVRNVRSYLYKVILNDILDAARRIERYKSRINKYANYSKYSINKNTPENALIETEETDKMFESIEGWLQRRESQAISLRYRDNFDVKETAKKMNVDDRTVSRYVSSGLSKIRHYLTVKQGG